MKHCHAYIKVPASFPFSLLLISLLFLVPSLTQMSGYSYRTAVRELVPQLRYLDDVKVEEDRLTRSVVMGENWDILSNLIKEISIKDGLYVLD